MFLTFEVLLLVDVLDLVDELLVLWFDVPDVLAPVDVTIIVPVIDGCIEQ